MTLPPLENNPKAIRLLKIQGYQKDTGYVSCSTLNHILGSGPASALTFVALSYVWGTQQKTFRILVNDTLLWVTPNLWCFLQYVASAKDDHALQLRDSYIWTDALCINQEDGKEKSRQVPLMGSIFSQAKKVVGWLHTPVTVALPVYDANWHGAMLLANVLAEAEPTSDESRPSRALVVETTQTDELMAAALMRLVEYGYWSRLWVVQEIALAQRVELLWEGHVIDWSRLKEVLTYLIRGSLTTRMSEALRNFIQRLARQFTARRWSIARLPISGFLPQLDSDNVSRVLSTALTSLISLVRQYSKQSCSVARDHVYALLAMAGDAQSLHVNYSESALITLARLLDMTCEDIYGYCEEEEVEFFGRLLDLRLLGGPQMNPYLGEFISVLSQKLPIVAIFPHRWYEHYGAPQYGISKSADHLPRMTSSPPPDLCEKCLQRLTFLTRMDHSPEGDVVVLSLQYCDSYIIGRRSLNSMVANDFRLQIDPRLVSKKSRGASGKLHIHNNSLIDSADFYHVELFEKQQMLGVLFETFRDVHHLLKQLWQARRPVNQQGLLCEEEEPPSRKTVVPAGIPPYRYYHA